MSDDISCNDHALMSKEKLKQIVNQLTQLNQLPAKFQSEIHQISELSQGNVNQVFRLQLLNGFSLIAKYAPPFAYRYQAIAINSERNLFEADILDKFAQMKESAYPEVYYYSEKHHLMLMEDLSDCVVMRDALIKGEIFNQFKAQVIEMIASYANNIPEDQSPQGSNISYKEGIVELQEITRLFVFEYPFGLDYPNGVLCLEENLTWVKTHIFENAHLQATRAKLQQTYYNKQEALIHGDLHTGSVMLNQQKMKAIDPEFAKIGPISFDIGMLIANLFISLLASNYHLKNDHKQKLKFQLWLKDAISYIYNQSIELLANLSFDKAELKVEIIGFCAIEIIRRTIGSAQVADFLSIDCHTSRQMIEKQALILAVEQLALTEKNNSIEASLTLVSELLKEDIALDVASV
ncbi:phosphotransferase [Thiotrichales bacterium 19X7-9]|nr:phosphotransferase [Thiotrichales bacterium 19X7-9]